MTEIREIARGRARPLGRDRRRPALDEADTVEDYLDWKRQARETIWLLASESGSDVGAAIGIGGWHSPEGVARGEVRVVADAARQRRRLGAARGALRLGARARLRGADGARQGGRRGVARLGGASRLRRGRAQLDARARPDGDRGAAASSRRRGSRSSPGRSGRAPSGDVRGRARGVPRRPGRGGRRDRAVRGVALDGHAGRGRPAGGDVRRARGRRGGRVREARRSRAPGRPSRCTT